MHIYIYIYTYTNNDEILNITSLCCETYLHIAHVVLRPIRTNTKKTKSSQPYLLAYIAYE